MSTTREVTFFTGDYEQQIAEVAAALSRAEKQGSASSRRVADSSEVSALRDRFNALRDEALSAARTVVLRSLTRNEWRGLKVAHPPRTEGSKDVVEADATYGVNLESIEDDLLYLAVVDPAFKSRAEFDAWAGDLGAAEFGTLLQAAFGMIAVAPSPKSLPALPIPSNDGTSDSPASTD